jgi:hypothetical protein
VGYLVGHLLARGAAMLLALAAGASSAAADPALDRGLSAIRGLTGCFLVDYSFVEVESFRPGYERDPRVYDVNRDKSVKEWITAEMLSPSRIRLQRVLFAADLAGQIRTDSLLGHQSEDWEHGAPFLYEFVRPHVWQVRDLRATPGLWTRRISTMVSAISARRGGRRAAVIPSGRAPTTRRSPAARPATWAVATIRRCSGILAS